MRIKSRNENFTASHKNGSASKTFSNKLNITPTQMVQNSSKSLTMINKVANELQAQVDRRNRYIDELLGRINTLEEEKDREFKSQCEKSEQMKKMIQELTANFNILKAEKDMLRS